MIRSIIIDDEPHAAQVLQILLEKHCADVKVEAVCHAAKDAEKIVRTIDPQLVFLDIEMPHMNGFELLEKLAPVNFQVIFTTSYDQYAIKAIKFSALDYLLKPVDREELEKAVQKGQKKISCTLSEQLEILLQKVNHPSIPVKRIALPTMQGLELVPINTII